MNRFIILLAAAALLTGCESDDVIECIEDCQFEASEYGNSFLPGGDDIIEADQDSIPTNQQEMDECNNSCGVGEFCIEGECIEQCVGQEVSCGGECFVLDSIHLHDCVTCAEGWCDADQNILNGCEISVMGNDHDNCGSCGHKCEENEACSNGVCTTLCPEDQLLCGTQCLNPEQLHLSDCNTCSPNYCDGDNNLLNGCEINALGSDVNNCGSCGHTCESGQSCNQGQCDDTYTSHKVMILVGKDTLNVRKGVGTEYDIIGSLSTYEYVTVLDEKDKWYKINYNGQEGWISSNYAMDVGDGTAGRAAIDVAEKFLYTKNKGLCTYDFLSHEPKIQYFTDLSSYNATYNYGYNDNCANFVTSSLKTAGLIAKNIISVKKLYNYCSDGTEGYHLSTIANAKPGDIWINSSLGHTELIVGNHKGTLILIGSNNFSSSESLQGLCANTYNTNKKYSSSPSKYQRVSYGSTTGGYVCSRQ